MGIILKQNKQIRTYKVFFLGFGLGLVYSNSNCLYVRRLQNCITFRLWHTLCVRLMYYNCRNNVLSHCGRRRLYVDDDADGVVTRNAVHITSLSWYYEELHWDKVYELCVSALNISLFPTILHFLTGVSLSV